MSLGKLLRVERTINIYKKTKSKYLGNSVQEINIDLIPFDFLKEIIIANEDDPLLYNDYELSTEQIENLNTHLENKITPNFKTFEYFLECYGIYEKTEN